MIWMHSVKSSPISKSSLWISNPIPPYFLCIGCGNDLIDGRNRHACWDGRILARKERPCRSRCEPLSILDTILFRFKLRIRLFESAYLILGNNRTGLLVHKRKIANIRGVSIDLLRIRALWQRIIRRRVRDVLEGVINCRAFRIKIQGIIGGQGTLCAIFWLSKIGLGHLLLRVERIHRANGSICAI